MSKTGVSIVVYSIYLASGGAGMALIPNVLILEKVSRNHLYGFRTAYTMSSDEVWYRANKIYGIALLVAGVAWLALGLILSHVMASPRTAQRALVWFGTASILLAVAVSSWLTYRK